MYCVDSSQYVSSHWRRAPAYHRLLLGGAGAHKQHSANHSNELWISVKVCVDSLGASYPLVRLTIIAAVVLVLVGMGLPRADLTSWNVG